ncbi:MAG: exodeoxyribonuclease III [bacterium]
MFKLIKLCSWNVNGIRAVAKKGFFTWLKNSDYDLVCLQETKAHKEQIIETLEEENLAEAFPIAHFNSAQRKGYSGVASFFKEAFKPAQILDGFDVALAQRITKKLNMEMSLVEAFNSEGRIICSHHNLHANGSNDLSASDLAREKILVLFNIYFPNGGANQERYRFKLRFYDFFLEYLKAYEEEYPNIVVTGDYNTAHNAIDLARPKDNEQTSGFIREERDYLDRLLTMGYIDTFRHLHPEPDNYTWWSYRTAARKRNVGWRIDYFFVSKSLVGKVKEAEILNQVEGSDHCPVSLVLGV